MTGGIVVGESVAIGVGVGKRVASNEPIVVVGPAGANAEGGGRLAIGLAMGVRVSESSSAVLAVCWLVAFVGGIMRFA